MRGLAPLVEGMRGREREREREVLHEYMVFVFLIREVEMKLTLESLSFGPS